MDHSKGRLSRVFIGGRIILWLDGPAQSSVTQKGDMHTQPANPSRSLAMHAWLPQRRKMEWWVGLA